MEVENAGDDDTALVPGAAADVVGEETSTCKVIYARFVEPCRELGKNFCIGQIGVGVVEIWSVQENEAKATMTILEFEGLETTSLGPDASLDFRFESGQLPDELCVISRGSRRNDVGLPNLSRNRLLQGGWIHVIK